MITLVNVADSDWLMNCIQQYYTSMHQFGPDLYPSDSSQPVIKFYQNYLSGKCPDVLVFKFDYSGFITCRYDDNRNNFWIVDLFVIPELQGHGIGTQLVQYAILIRDFYFHNTPIMLNCLANNRRAKDFYLSNGFNLIKQGEQRCTFMLE